MDRFRDELRWHYYFIQKGDNFIEFWHDYLASGRNLLFIAGEGFDPRSCLVFEKLTNENSNGKIDLLMILYDEGRSSPSTAYQDDVNNNRTKFEKLLPSGSSKSSKIVKMVGEDGHRIGSKSAAGLFKSFSEFSNYDDIVVDISAMPRMIYFSLIGDILYILDNKPSTSTKVPSLHIVGAENVILDSQIEEVGIEDEASYVHGFKSALDSDDSLDVPKIWIPILGERQSQQMERIWELVRPSEVCPILPMPSSDPRRSDNLLLEYRELFFDRGWTDTGDFIYASEQNPFDVYRQVVNTAKHYNEALKNLGGCKVVVSALSSKLSSVGALLASYEYNKRIPAIGIAQVETMGYRYNTTKDSGEIVKNTELFTIMLSGD